MLSGIRIVVVPTYAKSNGSGGAQEIIFHLLIGLQIVGLRIRLFVGIEFRDNGDTGCM